jgi:fructokinase
MKRLGGIEAGGTKFVCGIGTGPGDLKEIRISTTTPEATISAVLAFFREEATAGLRAIGIGSFGPVDIRPGSPTYGWITSTPKLGWRKFDLAGAIGKALGVPIGFDTDVNAAALGEASWGVARGISDFLYLTVGTGIGGGAIVQNRVLHGMLHPEMGHIRIPHDLSADPYLGSCPYHGDCIEGLASGPAMEARWGIPPENLPPEHPAWKLEARYLALAISNYVLTLSPQRIALGGGVMEQPCLLPLVRKELAALLAGYNDMDLEMDSFLVAPGLGSKSGVLGALVLAEQML